MQKQKPPEATKTVYPILRQIVNLIPPNVFHAAASATKDLSRVFTPWSHVVALIYQQITKTESLNGVCDATGEDVNANKQTNPVTTELKVK